VYLGQNLRFRAPVRPGDTVHATVAVKEVQPEKNRVVMSTVCTVGGKVVIDGEAVVLATSRVRRQVESAAGDEPAAIASQSSEAF
jgi:3-hydroxybutyryl-CoA dehydratase